MKTVKSIWAPVLFGVWTIFIFARSLQPAGVSDEESGRLLMLLQQLFPFELTNHVVRKAAHFIEYAVLGFFGWFVFVPWQEKRWQFLLALISCVAVAACDETIQLFVEGRAGRVSDVCLDTAGALAGVLAGAVVQMLFRRLRKK